MDLPQSIPAFARSRAAAGADSPTWSTDSIPKSAKCSTRRRPWRKKSATANESSPSAMLPAHTGVVSALGREPDGRFAASGGVDGKVRVWDLTHEPPREVAMLPRSGHGNPSHRVCPRRSDSISCTAARCKAMPASSAGIGPKTGFTIGAALRPTIIAASAALPFRRTAPCSAPASAPSPSPGKSAIAPRSARIS